MKLSEIGNLADLIGVLRDAFRAQNVTAETIGAYEMALSDLPIEAVQRAVYRAMRECKFFPSAVELRELAGVPSPMQRAQRAWETLVKVAAKHGDQRSVDFDDVAINATVRNLGGWLRFCYLDTEERHKWYSKDFSRVYVELLASGVGDEQAAPLKGYDEINGPAVNQQLLPPLKVRTGLDPKREWKPQLSAVAPKLLEQVRPTIKRA